MSKTSVTEAPRPKIPVHIVTGFLGSGKTTLLNHLLIQKSMEHTALIVNEFGETGFDHLLVKAATEDMTLLEGGCLCCSVRGDLVRTLENLHQQRQAGEIPEFVQIVVETTGLADPAPILRTLTEDVFVAEHYLLETVLTTVDALHAEGQISDYDESVKQIALAQTLILTKTAQCAKSDVNALRRRLRRINRVAPIYSIDEDELPEAKKLFGDGHYDPAIACFNPTAWLQAEQYRKPVGTALHPPGKMPHDAYIKSFCIEYAEPLTWRVLENWIQQLRRLRGKDLLRVKGIVYTVESDLPMLIQGVQHVFQKPVTLESWPDGKRASCVVFITRNIEKTIVEKSLHALIAGKTPQDMCTAAQILL